MSWIIGILTFILVFDCLLMILLILVQLPKKEAGLGTAFASGATDALFGAGTGNALTKLTKYVAVMFFLLTLGLSILNAHQSKNRQSKLEQDVNTLQQEAAPAVTPPVSDTNAPSPGQPIPAPVPSTNTSAAPTNLLNITLPQTAPAPPSTSVPPAPTTPNPGTPPAPAPNGASAPPSAAPSVPAPAPSDNPPAPKP